MSRSFVWACVPVLFAVTPLFAQGYYAPQQPPAGYAAPEDQGQGDAEDRGYAPPPRYQPQYQPRPDAPPPGYYYRQPPQQQPQPQPPYGYYQQEPRRPTYADNEGAGQRAPYARYDYGRQSNYYGQQPDYGRRPVYQQPQRAPQPEAAAPVPSTAPVAAAPVPEPAPTAAVDPADQSAWDTAKRENNLQAYTAYLDQHATGAHSSEAESAIDLLERDLPPEPVAAAAPAAPIKLASAPTVLPVVKGLPMKAVETAPVPVAPAAATDPVPGKPIVQTAAAAPGAKAVAVAASEPAFLCRPAFQGAVPYDQADAAEIAAYLQATRINSIAAYQAYLTAYPHGVFTGEVQYVVAARQGRMSQLAAAGLAPGAAHARANVTLTPADYPAVALRDGQQGTAVASWEVAEDGCVESCKIDRSSGSSALDAATCNVITERGRYDPAFSAQGKPVRATETAQLVWNLPQH